MYVCSSYRYVRSSYRYVCSSYMYVRSSYRYVRSSYRYVCSSYRYVREWLNGMIAAGFILLDKDSRCYTVPETHKPALANNIAFSPVAVMMGKRTDLLKKCFQKDGPWGKCFLHIA